MRATSQQNAKLDALFSVEKGQVHLETQGETDMPGEFQNKRNNDMYRYFAPIALDHLLLN